MGLFKSASTAGRNRPSPPPHSNIRGKISGPIPIPDEEFPMRTPGSSVAQEGRPKQLDPPTQRDSVPESIHTASNATREGEDKIESPARSGPSQSSTPSSPTARRRTNRSSTLRYSTLSDTTDTAAPSRKKSSLRAAFGKLFRRRNKKPSSRSVSDSEAQVGPPNGHHSDPVVGERNRINSESEPKRSASLPVTEFNKALRSHSIGPDDYMAIHSARNSLQSDSVFLRRRAATASDGPINSRLRDQSLDIAGLSPRPASAQGHDLGDDYDPDSIGRAVSVDYLTSRRRSRSLSQLNDVSEGQGLVRKRSEEIRYWRASQTPGPLSPDQSISNREEPESAETTGPTETTTETTQTPEAYEPIQPASPPEPFNFGSLSTMRITQAASLEERVAALELKNQKLERLVSQLFQVVPGIDKYADHLRHGAPPTPYAATSSAAVETAIHRDVPAGAGPLSPGYSVSEQSNVSFEDEMTFIGSIHPPTTEGPRPISNVTIRGATSLPSLPRDASGNFTTDHYDTLKALLDAERAMRHALEIRVTKLANMVDVLSRTTQNTERGPFLGGYPNISTFEHDDDDEYEGTEPPSASIDDSDAFETPREERPIHSYDVSDDEVQAEGDDEARKRAARTLSLGQLTLGKPKHTQQPGTGVDL